MKFVTLLIGATLLIASAIMVATKQYPIAVVDMSWIAARDFAVVNAASERFYLRALETYGKQKPDESEKAKLIVEIHRATLDRLIEETVIRNEAKKEIDALSEKIEEKMKGIDNQKLQNPVREMYGLSIEEFRRQVLEPQATQELLEAALVARGESLAVRLALSKKSTRVILLLTSFVWTEKGVELKNKM